MKRFINVILIVFMLSLCGLLFGCGNRYSNLNMDIAFSYNPSDSSNLDNGSIRVKTSTGTFDDNLDGSYTVYITSSSNSSANIDIVFENMPDNFNPSASFSLSNEIISVSSSTTFIKNGIRKTITAFSAGTTVLTAFSNEGGKKASVIINVVRVANKISFSSNNFALVNSQNSTLKLDYTKHLNLSPLDSSVIGVSYNLGWIENEEFVIASNSALFAAGLSFNKSNNTILIVNEILEFKNFYIQAIYENPLGENLTAYTKVELVDKIEDFELYFGSSWHDATPDNEILENDLKKFIINISDMNYAELVLRVRSNGENVDFSYLSDNKIPVGFLKTKEKEYTKIVSNSEVSATSYSEARYTYYYFKMTATKKTTENDNYIGGNYKIFFECNYSDYVVDGFLLKASMLVCCDTLIKNFSVNDVMLESLPIENAIDLASFYYSKVYINNELNVEGTVLKIDVANPISILSSNAKFYLTLFKDLNGTLNEIESFSNYFKIQKTVGNSVIKSNVSENLSEQFEKNTTFYIKANNGVDIGQTYYFVITAVEPNDEEFISKRAVAAVKLDIVQGITNFSSYEYSYTSYVVNTETGEYETDLNEEKITQTITETGLTFDQSLTGSTQINLDLSSGFSFEGAINYMPIEADASNIEIFSKDPSILNVEQDSIYFNKFIATPLKIGKTKIIIKCGNLESYYYIDINIYRPITNFYVNLVSTSFSDGVGEFELSPDNLNLQSAKVKVNESIRLRLSTLPITADRFTIKYFVYRESVEGTLVGSYLKNFDGSESSFNYLISDAYFQFDCKANSFVFVKDDSVNKNYVVCIVLENLDHSSWTSTFNLSCFVPVESIDISLNKSILYNPNNIAFESKTKTETDPTAFKIKIETNKLNNRIPTFNFENNGKIVVLIDGIPQNTISFSNGIGTMSNPNGLFLISSYETNESGFIVWFYLNPSYNYAHIKNVYVIAQIQELNNIFSSRSRSLSILSAVGVTNIISTTPSEIYFKESITPPKDILLQVGKENAYNKNLLVKQFKIIEIDKVLYYVEILNSQTGILESPVVNKTSSSNAFRLTFSALNAGRAVVVIMPQDKIIYQSDFDIFNQKQFISINILESDFEEGLYYVYNSSSGEYEPALSWEQGRQYYLYTTLIQNFLQIWQDYLTFYITVADGIIVPYQISSALDLEEVSLNSQSVLKKYVLTNDIILDSLKNWQPIGNYYFVGQVSQEDFENNQFYIKNGENFELQSNYVSSNQYYAFGFDGEFSGKFTFINVKTGITTEKQFKISNLSFAGNISVENNSFGFFARTGLNAKINDLSLNYTFFQTTLTADFGFGGISGANYGIIKNSTVYFDNFRIQSSFNLNIGGIAGQNFGFIDNLENTLGVSGKLIIIVASDDKNINIGGIAGENFALLRGSFAAFEEIDYTFNDAGFDVSLKIDVEKTESVHSNLSDTFIGGAVGTNSGQIFNVCTQGKIIASSCNNVGGLVGRALYNPNYNGLETYSICSSYSTMNIVGYDNVGGAIGWAGDDSEGTIFIYNISAENYVVYNSDRTFVKGNSYVGGLLGRAENIDIIYSYSISYFDCSKILSDYSNPKNYDVVALSDYAGGFAGYFKNCSVKNSSGFLNIKSEGIGAIFVADSEESFASNVFSIGNVYCSQLISGLNIDTLSDYYYAIIFDACDEGREILFDFYNSTTIEEICSNFLLNSSSEFDISESINSGLPYLLDENDNILFATTPIVIMTNIKDNDGDFSTYIKNDSQSLILFYSFDYLGNLIVEDVQRLNFVSLLSFSELQVFAKTHKSARLNISSSNLQVISILDDGTLKIIGEGKTTITISSKLNYNYKAEIYIVVKYGVNNIEIYSDVTYSNELENSKIEILKNKSKTLYIETEYTRDLASTLNATLKSTSEVGIRYIVDDNSDLSDILDALDGTKDGVASYTLSDLIKINNYLSWSYNDSERYHYIDVNLGANTILSPQMAMNSLFKNLKIQYIPFIKDTFNLIQSTILLYDFGSEFTLSIIKGATEIILENNLETQIKISQIQVLSLTIKLFTDYEQDEIVDMITDIQTGLDLTPDLIIVKSRVEKTYTDLSKTVLESISITYTISYIDKINAIETDKKYNFYFNASSDTTKNILIELTILGQHKLNQVYGTIYANLTDYPQQPDINDIIYNGNVGVLSVEVYPYFCNYSKMEVFYETTSIYPLFITQIKYDTSGETGQKLCEYPESGALTDSQGVMTVLKESGQDTHSLNDSGTYSYSRTYFLSLLVSSSVPDNTVYKIFVRFFNRQGVVIETFEYIITTIAQPSITFGFDKDLQGADDLYYLPINTENVLNVDLVNYDQEIDWQVESPDYELSPTQLNVLLPKIGTDGKFYVKLLDKENGVFDSNLIGKTLIIIGFITDGDRIYSYNCQILVTMFSVTGVSVSNTSRGYITLPLSTTTPLFASISTYYDENAGSEEGWYTSWYNAFSNDDSNELNKFITACGYEIEANFSNYFIQLKNFIAKADYNYKEAEGSFKTSGVWIYNGVSDSNFLQSNLDYNDSAFGVEVYNEFMAVYGYQIEKNSSLSLKVGLSYTNNEGKLIKDVYAKGIPNVFNYNVSSSNLTYNPIFNFEEDFILNFAYKSDLINAIPISSAKEFLDMKAGYDYRLINDIELADYIPINTEIASFDGNNYDIFITSFAYASDYSEKCVLGLFETVGINTILYNISVNYTNRVIQNQEMLSGMGVFSVSLPNSSNVIFGGIAAENKGTITNCKVSGKFDLILDIDIEAANSGGLVAINQSTGYITNSKVKDFELSCYGETGGFVGINHGKIVSSYFDNSLIDNQSSKNTGGFVNENYGQIFECFSQGVRSSNDNDIRNTGAGITSLGIIGGFVNYNLGEISDCYSNIMISSSKYIAGFLYADTNTSIISRCYSISYKSGFDNSTTASPFAGTPTYNYITINGELNNCYYLSKTGNWRDDIPWNDNLENKKAKGLSFDEFSTHTCFSNYDLSLIIKNNSYADNSLYNYIDGYTWAIIEGKPVLVSTLINTISQRDYAGKSKNYSMSYSYYDENLKDSYGNNILNISQSVITGVDKIKTYYYNNPQNKPINQLTDEDLIFTSLLDKIKLTLTYDFKAFGENEALTIVYSVVLNNNDIVKKTLLFAEYGNTLKKILDVQESDKQDSYKSDNNFRANDTILIDYNSEGVISKITYKVLESASYYYTSNSNGVSFSVGDRSNPQIIYDYESFCFYLSNNTAGVFYRIIKDIDFNYNFPTTSYSNFQGILQGNYMELNNISISYLNDYTVEDITPGTNAFGLFAQISGVESVFVYDTVISNLFINLIEVLSNSHKFVGGLAGQIYTSESLDNKVILNNISISAKPNSEAYIQGKNAVGGLVGIATGNIIIKDISSSVNINATKENSNVSSILYSGLKDANDFEKISQNSYAGGVIGIFDANSIIDFSTQRNYNATNIFVEGKIGVIGGIAGSVFGLVGENTVVNYVNTIVSVDVKNYIKAINYAGGLVGENRGEIISSSITYGNLENYVSVQIGASTLVSYNYFSKYSGSHSTIAIGGLVGLNNGGTIRNSISTVNTRNINVNIAGGAVGRMISGTLDSVIASGSVLAKVIVGGLIGTLNDEEIVENAGYDENLILSGNTFINNCVAANNWLVSDYSYYKYMLSVSNPVGAFIGLIAAVDGDNDFYEFGNYKNYFANTLYTSTNQTVPQSYLKPAYKSDSFDLLINISQGEIDVLYDSSNLQIAFPYSIREMYYENKNTGSYYSVGTKLNPHYDGSAIENPYVERIYTLLTEKVSSDLNNVSDLYKSIITTGPQWTATPEEKTFAWYTAHFGEIYNSQYILVTSGTFELGETYYYIESPILSQWNITKQYSSSLNTINVVDGSISGLKYDEATYNNLADIGKIKKIIINGLEINLSGQILNHNSSTSTFFTELLSFDLPNNQKIVAVYLKYDSKVVQVGTSYETGYYISNIQINYSCNPLENFITYSTEKNVSEVTYKLAVSSKEVVYKNFINNGFWFTPTNFFTNNDYTNSQKYLTNLEFSDTYIWTDFKSINGFYSESGSFIEISNAEQLALFSANVNNGNTYQGYTVKLKNDIDLSGKYWVPIGLNEENCFKGIFDGQGYSIKYATVNTKSNKTQTGIGFENIGIFGYVKDAVIKNIVLISGDISKGKNAGGLVGVSDNSEIKNIINRNNVEGYCYVGGIVGFSKNNSKILSSINYGNISNYTSNDATSSEVYVGGIAGRAVCVDGVKNYGKITIFNSENVYNYKILTIYTGGLAGHLDSDIKIENQCENHGDLTLVTNAHKLHIGGAFGYAINSKGLQKIKNFGNISLNYNNIYSAANYENQGAFVDIGGVVGSLSSSLSNCGNEGEFEISTSTSSSSIISVGGIAGNVKAMSEVIVFKSYNSSDIIISAINKKTKVSFGGIVGQADLSNERVIIEDNYNSGNLLSDSNATIAMGGIVGQTYFVESDIFEYDEEALNNLILRRCLNIGLVNLANINPLQNALGAISGRSKNIEFISNYYLKASAFSGSQIYSATTKKDDTLKFVTLPDENTKYLSRLSSTLKDKSEYDWDFINTWEQVCETWYPTIKGNTSSSLWGEKQDSLSQEKGYYIVSSAQQLAYLAAKINSGQIDSTNIVIKLINYIDLSNRYWVPIGTSLFNFRGTFDGNGYVIKNMTIDGDASDKYECNYGSLFGYITNATIKNVGLEAPIIKNFDYAAGIVFEANNSLISKVYVEALEIKDADGEIVEHVGEISGVFGAAGLIYSAVDCSLLDSNNSKGGIYYSYNNVPVSISKSYEDCLIAGLVARLENSLIDNCYNNSLSNLMTEQALDLNNDNISSLFITASIDESSSLFNVFNIASTIVYGEGEIEAEPSIYIISNNQVSLKAVDGLPLFKNLSEGENVDIKDIWTSEYSLNSNKNYPSLRGLGKEWKNTESEALYKYFDFDSDIKSQIIEDVIEKTGNAMVNFYQEDTLVPKTDTQSYYLISTAEQLAWVSTNVNNGSLSSQNCEFILIDDIDLSKRYWTPIGTVSNNFKGIFNFNGHVIKGLTIDSTSLVYGGLFGNAYNAIIANGYLLDSFIKIVSKDIQTNVFAGALVGKGYNTTIKNISVSTNIAAFSSSVAFVGGVIGSLTGIKDYLISNVRVNQIENSFIDVSSYYNQVVEIKDEQGSESGEIISSSINIGAFSDGGNVYVGGVVGYMSGYVPAEDPTIVYLLEYASNSCNLAGVSTSNYSNVFVGGIVGYALENVTINAAQSSGKMKSYTQKYDTIGGIVGYMNNGAIENSYFSGYIECTQDLSQTWSYLGGIAGYVQAGGKLQYCVNNGRTNSNDNLSDNASIGGIIGYSINRTFNNDQICVYALNNFLLSVGNLGPDFDSVYSTQFSDITLANGFLATYWNFEEGTLINKRIFLSGCQTSFEAEGKTLSTIGILVVSLDSITLKYGSGDFNSEKIGIALKLLTNDYIYFVEDLYSASDIVLTSFFTGREINQEDIIVCFVTLISSG